MYRQQQEINSLLSKIHAITLQGRNDTDNQADFARYKELADTLKILIEKTSYFLSPTVATNKPVINDYVTPKIRLRVIIFKDGKLMLMHKKDNQHGWALPGGWAPIGYSLSENIFNKVLHETGMEVRPDRIVAIKDISKHDYKPINLEKAYKIFVQATPEKIPEKLGSDKIEIKFVTKEEALKMKLAPSETLPEDIEMAFEEHAQDTWETKFD